MNSIHTNNAATTALSTLRGVDSNMEDVQRNVSTGYRVNTAANNAAYWSIATTMRSDKGAVSAVEDALGLGAATVDTAYVGMSDAVDVIKEIKAKLVAAREPGVDKEKINSELNELKSQLRTIGAGASFNGQNWLRMTSATDDGPKEVVGSFVRSPDNTVQVKTVTFDMTSTPNTDDVYYLIDDFSGDSGIITNSAFANDLGASQDWVLFNGENGPAHAEIVLTDATTDQEVNEMISVVDAMALKMADVASTLGALQSRIALQADFAAKFGDVIDKGVGRLVDADLSSDSTRFKALQTQQQLGTQALSIANSSAETMLRLLQ